MAEGTGKTRGAAAGGDNTLARVAWWIGRALVVLLSALVVAHWMAAVWDSGWFQLSACILLCGAIPLALHVLVKRRIDARGGTARFQLLTLMALLNVPVLGWAAVKQPGVFLDALGAEGLGAVKWLALQVGSREPGEAEPLDAEPTAEPTATAEVVEQDSTALTPPDPTSDVTPAAGPSPPGETSLEFESLRGQMIVMASVSGHDPMPFVLDTGASYSTLNAAAMEAIGLEVPEGAPERTMRTASGEATGALVLADRVTVGDQQRDGVVFWTCEPCAVGEAVGLLGLNIWQGYLLTIDPVDQTVRLRPRAGQTSRTLDVEPYLDLRATSSRMAEGELHVDLEMDNRAPRPVNQAVVLVTALDGRGREVGAFTVDAGAIAAGSTIAAAGSMPQAIEVERVQLELLDAWW